MTVRLILVLALGNLAGQAALADDWPQWRGPQRNGTSRETGLLREWPAGGPPLAWKVNDLGNGYSAPAVAGGRVYLQGNSDSEEFALALDAANGKRIWTAPLGKVGRNQGPQYPGTRATPTVDGDLVYCLGSDGDLVCLETASGAVRWKKQLKTDFGGVMGWWAYSESPLIDGDLLICTPGGRTATLLALHKKTGDVVWKCALPQGDEASYSSPIVVEVGGVRQYVQFVQHGLIGVDAKTGKLLWRDDRTRDPQANIPTPVFAQDAVFSGTSRNAGGLVKLTASGDGITATPAYLEKKLACSLGGVVLVGDHLYGTFRGQLACVDFATGAFKWQAKCVGDGAVCSADGLLFVRGTRGEVALVEASPDGYREKGRFNQPERSKIQAWPPPVVANGRLYLRDQNVLLCYDIKAK